MTDVGNAAHGHRYGARHVEFRIGAQPENLATLRTLVTAVGTFEDLDLDAVSDLRLAVDEACTRLIHSAVPDSTLVVVIDPRPAEVVVEAWTTCAVADVVSHGSFSWHVLNSLADDVRTFSNGDAGEYGGVFGISMTTRRAGSAR